MCIFAGLHIYNYPHMSQKLEISGKYQYEWHQQRGNSSFKYAMIDYVLKYSIYYIHTYR